MTKLAVLLYATETRWLPVRVLVENICLMAVSLCHMHVLECLVRFSDSHATDKKKIIWCKII